MGDSVPQHTGPNSLIDTHPRTERLRTRPTTTRENPRRWKAGHRDAQAACDFSCLASKSTPFFHMVKVIVASFRAKVSRAISGRIPLANSAA